MAEFNGTFSLFAFEKVNIQMSGACQYPIDQKTEFQELSSHGLSNKASGLVNVRCDRPFFIFKNHLECATTQLELTNENGGNLWFMNFQSFNLQKCLKTWTGF